MTPFFGPKLFFPNDEFHIIGKRRNLQICEHSSSLTKLFQNTHFLRAARAGNFERIQYYLDEKVEIDTANQVTEN